MRKNEPLFRFMNIKIWDPVCLVLARLIINRRDLDIVGRVSTAFRPQRINDCGNTATAVKNIINDQIILVLFATFDPASRIRLM